MTGAARLRHAALPLAIVAALALLWFGIHALQPAHSTPATLPDFSLPLLAAPESRLDAAALRGRPQLVNVWASWCIGCRREHDVLLRLAARHAVGILGIAWRDDPRDARRWLEQLGNPYAQVVLDADGTVAALLGVSAAPETLLIGPDGAILARHAGPLTEEIWRETFAPRLSALVPPATAVPAATPR